MKCNRHLIIFDMNDAPDRMSSDNLIEIRKGICNKCGEKITVKLVCDF